MKAIATSNVQLNVLINDRDWANQSFHQQLI